MAKRKYAVSDFTAKARDLITFEMIEQKLRNIKPGRKITIWVPKKKTNEDRDSFESLKAKL